MISKSKTLLFISLMILFLNSSVFSMEKRTNTYQQLETYFNTIKIINTHEHQMNPAFFKINKNHFYFLIFMSLVRLGIF